MEPDTPTTERRGSPLSEAEQEAPANAATAGRMKRNRDAAMGPTTPRGEGEESKVPGGLTPLAKKGRTQGDSSKERSSTDEHDIGSDVDSQPADDEELPSGETKATERVSTTPPRAAGLEGTSAPPTPIQGGDKSVVFHATEGTETKNIRQRVEALEWEDDGKGGAAASSVQPGANVAAPGTGDDTEIAEAAAQVADSAEMVQDEDKKVDEEAQDVEIANVADEVADSAAKLAKGDDKEEQRDVEIADVAAEVATSAQEVDGEDEKATEAAEVAAEVSESSKVVAKEDPVAPAPPAVQTSFSAFSSTASPFSSFSSTASPFAAVPAPSPSRPGPAEQKPKSKSTFGAAATPLTSAPTPSTTATPSTPARASHSPVASTSTAPAPDTPKAAPASSLPAWTKSNAAPSTPFGKSTSALGGASPFSAFAGKSGFAGAGTSTPSSGSGFGSYSAATASPFASVSTKDVLMENEDKGRKVGEAEEEDPDKPVFKEQEVVTGEEEDQVLHSVRSKLFVMQDGAWVERGTGLLKLNATKDGDKTGARLVMRADATHRLLLNATLFSKFVIEVNQEKYVRFAIIEGAEPISYMLRLSGPANAQNLVQAVRDRVALL
ncbi:hypothetical protein BCR35DRAFT_306422 [Leucosporidium creatinivorum]|uniref:RanBD1 domain-containing protein n=1 Tax=Leucosporidium creatinivorum TaxID=106004 RepID=A0A1Y2EUR6_9BASI|nr:hypothetical protein BCR35DRAFT_306422 [Leucosporidium creatinivorum]